MMSLIVVDWQSKTILHTSKYFDWFCIQNCF